jgi:hypothetical protein
MCRTIFKIIKWFYLSIHNRLTRPNTWTDDDDATVHLNRIQNSPGPAQVAVAGPAAFDSLVRSSDTNP